jgi:hypothetical protein
VQLRGISTSLGEGMSAGERKNGVDVKEEGRKRGKKV